MKLKNLSLALALGFALAVEPSINAASRGSSGSFSSGSRGSSGSSGWGSSSKSPGNNSFSGASTPKSPSSGFAPSTGTKQDVTSSSSESPTKKSNGWGKESGSTWGTSQKATSATGATSYKAPSKGEVALQRKATQAGTSYQSKDAAMGDFKNKYADKYPSKFNSEPRTRPDYIPRTYSYGGNSYNVVYNSGFGGYGYYNALGAWVMYDMMADSIMMNNMMYRNNYYYPGASYGGATVVHSGGIGFFWGFMIFLLIFVMFVAVLNHINN